MPRLSLTYAGDRAPGSSFCSYVDLANIECDDLLKGLAILHERLNAVAMPRVYRSTASEITGDLRANDQFPTTVSC